MSMDAPRLGSPRAPRHNALSPLQAFSPLREEAALPPVPKDRLSRPPTKTSAAPTAAARSKSVSVVEPTSSDGNGLRRSLTGRERAFSSTRRRGCGGSDEVATIMTRLLLVKAPSGSEGDPNALAGAAVDTSPRRTSFASSFATSHSSTCLPSMGSPPTSPIRSKHERHSSIGHGKPPPRALEPQQVLDLAKGLMTSVSTDDVPATGPKRARRKSVSGYGVSNPTPDTEALALEPVEYRVLPPGAMLPFMNRPEEVDDLIFNRNAEIADDLRQTLPPGPLRAHWADVDAAQYNFSELRMLMTQVDRPQCPDYDWVTMIRSCVRAHSVALWEVLGECLGCDADLMIAGDESGDERGARTESSAESTPNRVFIKGLPAVTPEERKDAEKALALEFGDPVDDVTTAWSMDTIGEDEPGTPKAVLTRPRSYVGIQILTSDLTNSPSSSPMTPSSPAFAPSPSLGHSPRPGQGAAARPTNNGPNSQNGQNGWRSGETGTPTSPRLRFGEREHFERSPGNPLFPSSFSTLSVEPTLGPGKPRLPPAAEYVPDARRRSQDWNAIRNRLSGTGLSESAITFVSDSSLEV